MKKFLILALGLTLLGTFTTDRAHAYSSAVGVDPDYSNVGNGEAPRMAHDVETKAVKKSATAGKSEALIAGLVVGYSSEADGYTVTRAVTQTYLGQGQLACVTTDEVATGDTNYHRCITKGFTRVRYDADTLDIVAGRPACVNASGVVRGCAYNAGATQEGAEATVNTGVIPLETKTSGTGTDLKVMLNLQ